MSTLYTIIHTRVTSLLSYGSEERKKFDPRIEKKPKQYVGNLFIRYPVSNFCVKKSFPSNIYIRAGSSHVGKIEEGSTSFNLFILIS